MKLHETTCDDLWDALGWVEALRSLALHHFVISIVPMFGAKNGIIQNLLYSSPLTAQKGHRNNYNRCFFMWKKIALEFTRFKRINDNLNGFGMEMFQA